MSEVNDANRPLTLEKRYEKLRTKLADYLLLQVNTFIAGAGLTAIGPAMEILTNKSAELKVRSIREKEGGSAKDAVYALSQELADSMGETFNSDYTVENGRNLRTVTLGRCGCIESVLESAERYDMAGPQARSIFCGACMNSYRKAASTLGLGFKGKLSKAGCVMGFSEK